ncbi:Glycogen synthase [Burkholderiaceae bacterium]|nr:Glycogen synthase [Burkholderiaceae bacterium]
MRILVVSTVYNSTPPVGYGGIQRVVHSLTEALVRQGHEVILMAPPRSSCSGRTVHVPAYDPERPWSAVKGEGDLLSEEPLYEAMREFLDSERVDVIHDWSFQSLFVRRHPQHTPFVVSTCIPPGPGFERTNLVASGEAHARLIGGTTRHVHYGLPLRDWKFEIRKSEPPIHIAKIARFKAQHLAILASMRARRPLVVAGNVENERYFNFVVRPLLWLAPQVRYIGEIAGTQEALLRASALIQTPRWFDCFPLVVLEALASATPVIALAEGGLPEQVKHGVTGFLCHDVASLAEAMSRIGEIDPRACRADAQARFSDEAMARAYVELYQRALAGERW